MKKSIVWLAGFILPFYFLSSCSESRELMAEIPADSEVIARIDARSLLELMGLETDDGSIKISSQLQKILDENEVQISDNLFPTILEYLESDDIFFFTSKGSSTWVVAKSTDSDGLKKFLSDNGLASSKEGGYETMSSNSYGKWFLKGDLVWWNTTGNTSTPSDLVNSIKKDGSIGDVPGAGDFLRRDGTFKVAVRNPADKGQWICGDVKFEGAEMKIEALAYNAEGTQIHDAVLAPINTGFLRYIPENPMFVGAAGLTKNFNWKLIGTFFSRFGLEAYAVYESLLPALKSIDGTLAVAVEYKGQESADTEDLFDFDYKNYKFIILAEMKSENALATISNIRQMLALNGMSPDTTIPDRMTINYFGFTINVIYQDGYLMISNYVPEESSDVSMGARFEGNHLCAVLNLNNQRLSQFTGEDFSFGIDANVNIHDNKGFITVKLTDQPLPFLLSIIKNALR